MNIASEFTFKLRGKYISRIRRVSAAPQMSLFKKYLHSCSRACHTFQIAFLHLKKKKNQAGRSHPQSAARGRANTNSIVSFRHHLQLCKQNPRSTNIFTLTVSPACYLIFPFLPPCVQIRGPPRRHARHWIFPCFCLRKEVYMFHYGAQLGWRARFFQLEESY